ncbi:TIGR02710 family CRISPR-associated CARF protein [Rhodothermus marinus]|uniref:CRISPR-associated protein, TIGR02710 family n=1 Tax=Rhodothermus marinus (strain ATCC 43812 / DSM 4252 / R-10) TaxID=518766 RepID=D0MKQ5_RHOM4|nr:TIGR02710 family CRISPR-associated CARF protein [Rhodothermus marinus]ACY49719.1 CRISPR-associated protein, TIGR02710 family [Rhodothermus marinus DSM 4252]AEN74772.1 CRISPR-associated protein, TIGR02710 family [Rhodothermus marinus SG0.5JP17-172]
MRVRFLLVRLPFQQSMVLVMKELEGEQRVAIVPVVAPGETFHEEQAYRIFQEVAAGRLPAGAEELGEFEFPDEEAAQEAARDFVKNLKESLWGEVEAFGEKQQPSSVDTVLLLTVGGSTEPLVHAIRNLDLARSRVLFICSPDSRTLVEGGEGIMQRLPDMAGLERSRYDVMVWKDPDDLAGCVAALFELYRQIRREYPGARIAANYTGGTKTMSAALVIGAVLLGWELQLNVGVRQDLRQVLAGTDVPTRVAADDVLLRLELRLVRQALDRYDYGAAEGLVQEWLRTLSLGGERRTQVLLLYQIVRGLAAWDLGQYRQALVSFGLAGEHGASWLPRLRVLAEGQEDTFELVADLLLGAARRAHQRRYDDAVVRLLRALELFGTIRLRQAHGLDVGQLEPARLPERLRETLASTGYRGAVEVETVYRLLEALGDPVGRLFAKRRTSLLEALEQSRHSRLIGGNFSIDEQTYGVVRSRLEGFLHEAARLTDQTLQAPQLPRSEVLDWVGLE